jgi:nitroreductase
MINKPAETSVAISELLTNRWSPRVYDKTHSLTELEKTRLAEAARWAPSGNNSQPWKFAFIDRDNPTHAELVSRGLTGFNQTWAPNASSLIVSLVSKTRMDGTEADKAAMFFNNALATSQIVYEAEAMGLKAHYMTGINFDEIANLLGVTDHWVVCIVAVGKQGEIDGVTEELKERETAPRTRKPLSEILL